MSVSESELPETVAPAPWVSRAAVNTACNAVLVAVAFAGAVLLPRLLWPWWISAIAALLTAVGLPTVTGLIVLLFRNQLTDFARAEVSRESTRAVALAVLGVDALLLGAFLMLPQQRIVRIVPGPRLLIQCGLPGRTLTVVLEGAVYHLSPPPRRPLYAGHGSRRVLYAVSQEPAEARAAVLADVLEKKYGIDPVNPANEKDKKAADGLLQQWSGQAANMPGSGSGLTGFRAFLRRPRKPFPVALALTPIQSSSKEGIETYAAELP